MRHRLPLFLACLMILPALLVAGCGDDNTGNTTPVPESSSQDSSDQGSTGSTGEDSIAESAGDSAKATYDSCIEAADQLPDNSNARDAKNRCQQAYDNIKEATDKMDQKTDEAREKCKDAANNIPNADAKAQALAACDKFQ